MSALRLIVSSTTTANGSSSPPLSQNQAAQLSASLARATQAERRLTATTTQLNLVETKFAEAKDKVALAEGKWETRLKELKARAKASDERVRREREGAKDRVKELGESIKCDFPLFTTKESLTIYSCEQESRITSPRCRKEESSTRRSDHQLRLHDERSSRYRSLPSIDSSTLLRFVHVARSVIGSADYGDREAEDGAWSRAGWVGRSCFAVDLMCCRRGIRIEENGKFVLFVVFRTLDFGSRFCL